MVYNRYAVTRPGGRLFHDTKIHHEETREFGRLSVSTYLSLLLSLALPWGLFRVMGDRDKGFWNWRGVGKATFLSEIKWFQARSSRQWRVSQAIGQLPTQRTQLLLQPQSLSIPFYNVTCSCCYNINKKAFESRHTYLLFTNSRHDKKKKIVQFIESISSFPISHQAFAMETSLIGIFIVSKIRLKFLHSWPNSLPKSKE